MEFLFKLILGLVVFKAIVIGSEFNFHYWFRDGKRYTEWYNNRPEYKKEE